MTISQIRNQRSLKCQKNWWARRVSNPNQLPGQGSEIPLICGYAYPHIARVNCNCGQIVGTVGARA
jgi:hypothetical protein